MKQAMIAYSFQGASHIKKEENIENKGKNFPCQDRCFAADFAASEISERKDVALFVKDKSNLFPCVRLPVDLNPHKASFSMVCVSDGHGGSPYFRSQRGAEFAVQTSIELLSESIDKISAALQEKNYQKVNKSLSKSFVRRWMRKIIEEFSVLDSYEISKQIKNLESEDEKAAKTYQNDLKEALKLAKKYDEIKKKTQTEDDETQEISSLINDFSKLSVKSIFGCTVVVYFQIKEPELWYAFKIGDSDFFASFDRTFVKPIKDDPKCYENVTTSLCDDNAEKEFCFPEKKFLSKIPETVFCSSDGVANSFADEDYLKKFYSQLQFSYDEEGDFHSGNDLKEYLPQLSLKGSGDDVSLAGIINFDDSVEAKKSRRQNALELGKKYFIEGKYPLICPLFKPYLDRQEINFKSANAFYDYKETLRLSEIKFDQNFLKLWDKTYAEFNELLGNINLINSSEKLKNFVKSLHQMMEKTIKQDLMSAETKNQKYIDELFGQAAANEVNVFFYYKSLYEYELLKISFEKGNLTVFNDLFVKAESDLSVFARSGNFSFVENSKEKTCKMLSEMYSMKAKYWESQK